MIPARSRKERKWREENVILGSFRLLVIRWLTFSSLQLVFLSNFSSLQTSFLHWLFLLFLSIFFLLFFLKVHIDPRRGNDGHSFDPRLSKGKNCKCCRSYRCLSSPSFLHGTDEQSYFSTLWTLSLSLSLPSFFPFSITSYINNTGTTDYFYSSPPFIRRS